jgi:DNA (cytosine-5)-methyltransferase 1
MSKHSRPIGIDLFAGAGGLSLGFEQAGFDVVAAVEIDPIHAAIHEFNFPLCKTVCRSVENISGDELRRVAGLGECEIDVVFGGAPCQGFSMIGKRAFDDPRNSLVRHFVRLVVELNAKYFVFENVKGLTIGRHKRFLQELIESFQDAGYDVVEDYRVLNAADYGVPQDRRRLFLMGCRRGLRLPAYPDPTESVKVREALSDLPNAEDFEALRASENVRARLGNPSKYAAQLRGIETDVTDFGYARHFDSELLTASLRTEHTEVSRRRFAETEHGKTEPISRFHKLNPDGVCNTLRAGTASDRGAFTSPRPIHPEFPRVITVREAARLHSYPDWFRFHSTKWHGFRQIGNSVPPRLGRAVAGAVIGAMGVAPTKPEAVLDLGDERLLSYDMSLAARHFQVSPQTIAKRTRHEDRTLGDRDTGGDLFARAGEVGA